MHTNAALKLKPLLRAMDSWGDDVRKRQLCGTGEDTNAAQGVSFIGVSVHLCTVGISSASGPSEVQDALDEWCASGGALEYDDGAE